MWRHGLGVLAGAWLSSCVGGNAFPCHATSECVDGGRLGVCQSDGWCSFPDAGCPSGQRYGEHAGEGLAGLCVGDDGTTGGDGTPVESSSDAGEPTIATLEATGPVTNGGDSTTGDDADTMGASATATSSPTSMTGPDDGGSTTDDPTDPSGTEPLCGNGIIDDGESCDGANFGLQTCSSLVPGSVGTLSCDAQCQVDTSACAPANDDGYLPCDVDDECPAEVCHLFAGNGTCLPICMDDNGCPSLMGAGALPFCADDGFCLVPCTGDDTCPEGMRCDDSVYGMVCLF